jgi:PadR family transcriptional regulator PadR
VVAEADRSETLLPLSSSKVTIPYVWPPYVWSVMANCGLKTGSAALLILALIEERPRHGYEISRLIESRSDGTLRFHVASLYPTLYRMEKRGLVVGRWVEKAGQRRRRYYRLTPAGKAVLAEHRTNWETFILALKRVAGLRTA